MVSPAYVIQTHGLTKHYGDVLAVDEVELRVQPGEIYGFLGLNGAGKTTTIRMLLGMVRPSAGEVALFGERIRPGIRDVWHQVGHMVEGPAAYPELSVRENLEACRRLYGLHDVSATSKAIERFGLEAYAERRAATLSTGNLQRLGLARALLHQPELLILDEPANGLDPAGVVEVRQLLTSLALEQGVTVFMSSHLLAEVERLATRIGIIHKGRLIEELNSKELDSRRLRWLVVGCSDLAKAGDLLKELGYTFLTGPEGFLVSSDRRALEAPEEIATAMVAAGTPPSHLAIEQEDLEQLFFRLTGEKP